jgi:hypothetical protein
VTRKICLSAFLFGGLVAGLSASWAAELAVPADHATIQEAIDAANVGDIVTVSRGTYDENFTLKPGVVVQGEEAAKTFLTGEVGGTGGTLQRFTIATTGLSFAAAVDGLVIRNNIFSEIKAPTSVSDTALQIANSTGFEVSNNTFFDNGTALTVDDSQGFQSTGTILANAFSENAVALSAPMVGVTKQYNLFHDNEADGDIDLDPDAITGDPLLVNPTGDDFHLQAGSPCIDVVPDDELADLDDTDADCGAYGGPEADPIPFQVSGLGAAAGDTADSVRLTWSENEAYNVTDYNIYYGLAAGDLDGQGADNGDSPFEDVGTVGTVDVTGLAAAAGAPPAPTGVSVLPGPAVLEVTWDEVEEADGYLVLWGTVSGVYDDEEDVGNTTRHTITGLQNGVTYFVAVRSYASTTYFFAVSALTEFAADVFESRLSDEASFTLQQTEGGTSDEVSEQPEEVEGFPDLPDRGLCFIGTTRAPRDEAPQTAVFWLVAALAFPFGLLARRRKAGRRLLLLVPVLLVPLTARAEEPRWTVTVVGGIWLPAEDDWDDHYDSQVVADVKAGGGFRLTPWCELGLEVGYRKAEGEVDTTESGSPLGTGLDQTLRVVPVQPYVLVDLMLSEDQLLVPYVAAGWTRYYYDHEVDSAPDTDGHINGYYARGGVKLLLNRVEPRSAKKARDSFGLKRTYFVTEAQFAKVDDFGGTSADLGGWSFFAGTALQF